MDSIDTPNIKRWWAWFYEWKEARHIPVAVASDHQRRGVPKSENTIRKHSQSNILAGRGGIRSYGQSVQVCLPQVCVLNSDRQAHLHHAGHDLALVNAHLRRGAWT
jgi:hypothetical protein